MTERCEEPNCDVQDYHSKMFGVCVQCYRKMNRAYQLRRQGANR